MRRFFGYFSESATLAIVAVLLIVGPLNFGSRSVEAQGWLHLGSALLLLFWMIRLMCLAEPVFLWTKVTLPLLCLLGYVFLRYLFCDVKWVARQEFLMFFSYTVIFLAVINNLQRRWQLQTLFWVIVAVAAAQATDGILRRYQGGLEIACRFFFFDCRQRAGFQNLTRAGGTFLTPDHYAALLLMALSLIAAHLITLKRSWTTRIFLFYFGAMVLIGIGLSKSRGGWVALLATLGFFVLILLRGRLLDFRATLVGVVLAAGVLYYLWTRYPVVAERMQELAETGEPTRQKMYLAALQMARDNPIFGVGPRMYDLHFWQYQFNPSGPQFVHSEYLQTLADLGLVGVALMGWLLVAFYRSVFQMAAPRSDDFVPYLSSLVAKRIAFVVGGAAAVFAMSGHAAVDFVLHVMGLGVTFATLAAMVFAAAAWRRKNSEKDLDAFGLGLAVRALPLEPRPMRLTLGGLGAGFVLFLFLGGNNLLATVHRETGYRLAHQAEPDRDEAIRHYELALRFDPRDFTSALWLGTVYWEKSGGLWESSHTARQYYEKSLFWHERAIRLNPYFGDALLNRAHLYMYTRQPERARADCERLIAICPDHPAYRLLYGRICFMLADYPCATEQFQRAWRLYETYGDGTAAEARRYYELVKDIPKPEQE